MPVRSNRSAHALGRSAHPFSAEADTRAAGQDVVDGADRYNQRLRARLGPARAPPAEFVGDPQHRVARDQDGQHHNGGAVPRRREHRARRDEGARPERNAEEASGVLLSPGEVLLKRPERDEPGQAEEDTEDADENTHRRHLTRSRTRPASLEQLAGLDASFDTLTHHLT